MQGRPTAMVHGFDRSRKFRALASAVAAALLAGAASAQVPTWTYDADSNVFPNATGQPFESPGYAFGGNNTRSLIDLGGGDIVLEFNTGSGQGDAVSSGFEIDAPAPNWNVSGTTGYSVEWRARLDPSAVTNRSAAAVFAGNPSNWAFTRFYDEFTNPFNPSQRLLTAELQSADGNAGGRLKTLGNPYAWHTYRMDVQNGVGRLYVDNYHSPVIVKNNLVASGAHAIWFGDGTGVDNGRWQLDYIKSYQSGPVGAPPRPNASTIDHTLFIASYDGNTANGGLDADFARGSVQAVGTGGVLAGPGKFGAAALDSITASGTVNYPSADNFNVERGTVEMWIKANNWNDGEFAGFFDIFQANPILGEPAKCDIRIQKTSAGRLQAYAASADNDDILTSWSVTSEPVNLDTEWHHLAWSWDENVNMSYLYLDGNVIADFSATFAPPTPNPGQTFGLPQIDFLGTLGPTIEVGSVQDGSAPFNGLIDELRISGIDLYQGGAFTPANAPFELQRWNVNADGNWSNAANWAGGVPDAVGATANFLGAIATPRTITVDGPRTVGIMRFDNAAASYTVAGPGPLVIDVGTGAARISVISGSHEISAPVSLQDNANFAINPSASLNLSGQVDGVAGATITKDGGGTLAMKNLRVDNAVVNAGTLRINPNGGDAGASKVLSLTVNSGAAKLDLTDNLIAVDYDGPSPINTIASLITTGRNGGDWAGNGLTSSTAAANSTARGLGYAEAVDLGLTTIAGQTVDDTTVIVRFTILGDANLDRTADIGDFGLLAANFNQPGGWSRGDFNYDMVIDIGDFSILASNFNQSVAATSGRGAAVPEPGAAMLGLVAAAGLVRRRR